MARTVERIQGLGVAGRARLGALEFDVPALLDADPSGARRGEGLHLRPGAPTSPGRRSLLLEQGDARLPLEFAVPNPEVSGAPGAALPIGTDSWLVDGPPSPDALADLLRARPSLVVLGNARALWAEGAPFVATLGQLRRRLGAAPLLWTPRVALPHRLPLLHYLGVDLVDTTAGQIGLAEGRSWDETLGEEEGEDGGIGDAALPGAARDLEDRYRAALARTRAAARGGRLRELVEARLASEPALAEMLRYADRDLEPLLDQRAPVTGARTGRYVLAESFRRPEVRRFRRRLLERYRPPPSKEVLLLVPCSRTKPYRQSPSHRRFSRALEGLERLERVHVVSVSSPVGLVPRELEDLPPARHYDVPVTGEWSEPERTAIEAGLGHLLAHGRYRAVVAHLDRREYGFLEHSLGPAPSVTWTVADDRARSAGSLRSLRSGVERALAGSLSVPGGPLAVVREELHEIAAMQFGRTAAALLFAPPLRLAGRPWAQRLTDGEHRDLATWREERGLFQLTVAGARRFGGSPPLAVEVRDGFPLTGDLFVPGVKAASEEIREGDAVVLLRSGELLGVGEAILPGPMMLELERGAAVHVRHRVPGAADTAFNVPAAPAPDGPVVQR